ncbi:MAG: thioesterase domain-containing protein, partial [Verrucomicrobiales bacterium]|nr:thioesterase domain-containing protein [Verrucomicrobiales bacterium]
AILSHNPDGPYYFMGYSLGGMLAYEISKLMTTNGKNIGLVALLDTYNGLLEADIPSPLRRLIRRTGFHFRKFYYGPRRSNHALHLLERSLEIYKKHILKQRASEYERLIQRALKANYTAIREYKPSPHDIEVLLFRATIDPLFKSPTRTMGWEKLALGGVDVVDVPSMHIDITSCQPSIKLISEALDKRIPK